MSAGDLTQWNNDLGALITSLGLTCGDVCDSSGGSLLIKKPDGDVERDERKTITRWIVNSAKIVPGPENLTIVRDVCNVCEKPGLPPDCDCYQ